MCRSLDITSCLECVSITRYHIVFGVCVDHSISHRVSSVCRSLDITSCLECVSITRYHIVFGVCVDHSISHRVSSVCRSLDITSCFECVSITRYHIVFRVCVDHSISHRNQSNSFIFILNGWSSNLSEKEVNFTHKQKSSVVRFSEKTNIENVYKQESGENPSTITIAQKTTRSIVGNLI